MFDKLKGQIVTLGRIDQMKDDIEAYISIDSGFKKCTLIPLLNAFPDGSLDILTHLPVREADDKDAEDNHI